MTYQDSFVKEIDFTKEELLNLIDLGLKFKSLIHGYNEAALANPAHPRAVYREPDALIIICATAPIAYTTSSGVKVIPVGCLRD